MTFIKHDFTFSIIKIIEDNLRLDGETVIQQSLLLQYLNIKTKSAHKGSKSRASLANHYALYVLIEDYLQKNFDVNGNYINYEGVQFSVLLERQRQLPFGQKLQNHALNHRLNEEFKKYFPTSEHFPVLRDASTNKYWINENLIKVKIDNQIVNISKIIIKIIDEYIEIRRKSFQQFITYCETLKNIEICSSQEAIAFIQSLLQPHIDARIFEIVSFAILKFYYNEKILFWGWSPEALNEEALILYKTGRTNANDGGIDFVMKPLGRFFQVTETIDVGKYFLDIDKVQKYPLTFVIKSQETPEELFQKIEEQAKRKYPIYAIVEKYLNCIEEIINIPYLIDKYNMILEDGKGNAVINEIILQSRLEFNMETNNSEIIDTDI